MSAYGIFVTAVTCTIYAVSSLALTLTNKAIYTKFDDVSPFNLLMVQCEVSVAISSLMMIYKECNPSAFHFLVKYGIVIPPITDL